jgi:hypothetical protein
MMTQGNSGEGVVVVEKQPILATPRAQGLELAPN